MSGGDQQERSITLSTSASAIARADDVPRGRVATSMPGYLGTIALTIGAVAAVPLSFGLVLSGVWIGALSSAFVGGLVVAAARRNAALFYPLLSVELPPEPLDLRRDDAVITVRIGDGGVGTFTVLAVKTSVVVKPPGDGDEPEDVVERFVLVARNPQRGDAWSLPLADAFPQVGGRAELGRDFRIEAHLALPWLPEAVVKTKADVLDARRFLG